jgi:WhiB family transcriptional regulator, redox-sensing transcriptional regulator
MDPKRGAIERRRQVVEEGSQDLDLTWHALAACRGMETSRFFDDDAASIQWAKRVCRGCAVRDTCREQHLLETDGVWGGLSSRERRRLARLRSLRLPLRQ